MSATPVHEDAPPPRRGTRPRNRRELILVAASHLFYERGYEQVAMGDIAEAVNVTPSALYRHVSSKAELLYAVVDAAIDVFDGTLMACRDADLDQTVAHLASAALDHRDIGVLWQRESRNLHLTDQVVLRERVNGCVRRFAARLCDERAELPADQAEVLVSCALNAMTSLSFHHLELPRPAYVALVARIASSILSLTPSGRDQREDVPGTTRTSSIRRDELLNSAVRLFAAHGFTAVTIDDIGDAVGIAGPSVYNYFTSKQQLLMSALEQAGSELSGSAASAWSGSGDVEASLRRVTSEYVEMALDHGDRISALITESRHLGADDARDLRAVQRDFIEGWVAHLRRLRPDETEISARIKVQTAQMVANDMGRTRRMRRIPGFRGIVHDACWIIQS